MTCTFFGHMEGSVLNNGEPTGLTPPKDIVYKVDQNQTSQRIKSIVDGLCQKAGTGIKLGHTDAFVDVIEHFYPNIKQK